MLSLTDAQLDAVFAAAQPLDVADRDKFLRDVATILAGIVEPGDGDVHRAIVTCQRRHFRPPAISAHPPLQLKKIGRRRENRQAPASSTGVP